MPVHPTDPGRSDSRSALGGRSAWWRSPSRRLALLLVLVWPTTAFAHGALKRSDPAAGDTVASSPSAVRLEFTERVELRLVRIALAGPGGRAVDLSEPRLADEARTIVVVAPTTPLGPGRYIVRWQVAGADGHPTRGTFAFTVGKGGDASTEASSAPPAGLPATSPANDEWRPASGAPAAAPATGAAPAPSSAAGPHETADSPMARSDRGAGPSFSERSSLYVVIRWVQYVAAFLVLGGFVFCALVIDRVRAPSTGARDYLFAARTRAMGVARAAALVLIIAQGARLLAQRATLRVATDAAFDVSVADMVLGTYWGTGWLLVLAGALLALTAIVRAERAAHAQRGAGEAPLPADLAQAHPSGEAELEQALADVGVETLEPPDRNVSPAPDRATPRALNVTWFVSCAVIIAVGLALSGHQAASPIGLAGVAVDAIHVLATAGWIGTLGALVLAGLLGRHLVPAPHDGVAALLRTFSPVVLVSAAIGGGAGLVLAYVNVGSFAALWSGTYGRVLVLKLAVLSLVAATGAYNWRRVVPVLGTEGATRALRRSASAEAVIAVVVIAITSVLVAMPPAQMP